MEILEARRSRADHHDLVAEDAGGHAPSKHLPERDAAEGTGASAVVDQRVASGELRRRERLPARALSGDDGKALEMGDLVRVVRDHPALRGRQVGGRRARMNLGQVGVASEDIGAALGVALAGRQRHVARGADGVVEVAVLLRRPGLGELDVVDDLARAGCVQAVDHARVKRTRERPRLVELAERPVVDLHDHDVRRRRRVPEREPRRDACALERIERTGELGKTDKRKRCDGGHEHAPHAGLPASETDGASEARRAAGRVISGVRGTCGPSRTITVTLRTRSRTATLPLVTLTSVPSHVSRVNHAVPRTVATAERPRVTKRPWLSFPQSWRTRGLFAVAEDSCRADFAQLSGAVSVSTVVDCLPRVWRNLNEPPQNLPVCSLPPALRTFVSLSAPRVASIVVPTGTVEAAESGR